MIKYFILLFIIFFNFNALSIENYDKNKPIKITANDIFFKKNEKLIIFIGKVEATQNNLKIFSNKMHVNYIENNDKKLNIKSINFFNNIILKNDNITIRGDRGFYDFKNNLITIEGNIIMNENDTVIFGEKAKYNTETEETNIYGESFEHKNKERITIILDNIDNLKERYDK